MSDVVVVSTHFDDAVLSCFGVLSPSAVVITVLAGAPPSGVLGLWDAQGGATDSATRVAERRDEDRRALRVAGARLLHMDFPDGQYVATGSCSAPTIEALVESLQPHLSDAAAVFAPSALWHDDHKLVRDAVLQVRSRATLYADLPYALAPGRGGFGLPADVDHAGRHQDLRHLDTAVVRRKIEAVGCYQTQLAQMHAIFGDFVNPAGLGQEAYWTMDQR
jgi:LmbE family N-acetylglucosaminyl deacetylase